MERPDTLARAAPPHACYLNGILQCRLQLLESKMGAHMVFDPMVFMERGGSEIMSKASKLKSTVSLLVALALALTVPCLGRRRGVSRVLETLLVSRDITNGCGKTGHLVLRDPEGNASILRLTSPTKIAPEGPITVAFSLRKPTGQQEGISVLKDPSKGTDIVLFSAGGRHFSLQGTDTYALKTLPSNSGIWMLLIPKHVVTDSADGMSLMIVKEDLGSSSVKIGTIEYELVAEVSSDGAYGNMPRLFRIEKLQILGDDQSPAREMTFSLVTTTTRQIAFQDKRIIWLGSKLHEGVAQVVHILVGQYPYEPQEVTLKDYTIQGKVGLPIVEEGRLRVESVQQAGVYKTFTTYQKYALKPIVLAGDERCLTILSEVNCGEAIYGVANWKTLNK